MTLARGRLGDAIGRLAEGDARRLQMALAETLGL